MHFHEEAYTHQATAWCNRNLNYSATNNNLEQVIKLLQALIFLHQ